MMTNRLSAVAPRPLHVLQLSRDADLLRLPLTSEPAQRQLGYARELQARIPGSRVTILVLCDTGSGGAWQHDNVSVLRVPTIRSGPFAVLRAMRDVHATAPVSIIAAQVPHDEAWLALLESRRQGFPVIAQVHSDLFAPLAPGPPTSRAARAVHRWATCRTLSRFSAIRTVSTDNERRIARVAPHVPLTTIPVPVAMLSPVRREDTGHEKHPVVLFVGRLAPEKNLALWMRVAAEASRLHDKTRFVIVGDGPERAVAEAEMRTLGLDGRVTFTGFLPNAELPDLYRRAAAVLLTSHSEGFGRVLVEAASQGTAAVATASAGPNEVIVHGVTGYVHDATDIGSLARSVATLASDPLRAAAMGERARVLAHAKFHPDRLRSAWVDLWIATATARRRSA